MAGGRLLLLAGRQESGPAWPDSTEMKLVLEIVLSIVLHPLAFLLMLLNVLGREDLSTFQKTIWIVVGIFWGIGPILYILVGGGALW